MDDQAEFAALFYSHLLPNGKITEVSYYPETFDNPAGKPKGSVLTVEFEFGGLGFTALNGGPGFVPNPSVSFLLRTTDEGKTTELFEALTIGGKVLMPLESYPFSQQYGWVQDRYGVSWQLMRVELSGGTPTIAPCLTFTGSVCGRAEDALLYYSKVFPNSKVLQIERYEAGEGTAGQLKHGRFLLNGQELMAMDGQGPHAFRFNEGVSFQVLCDTQRDVDTYWEALSEAGQPGPCGWLKDKFGLSWQIVPKLVLRMMASKDTQAKERVFRAMLTMSKLELDALNAAFHGQ